jgi:hypothetical protein
MAKPVKVLMIYLFSLFAISLVLSWLKWTKFYIPLHGHKLEIETMMFFTIAGGIIALRKLVSSRALKVFLVIYVCLWLIRFGIIYLSFVVKDINVLGRVFHVDIITPSYYNTISRLATPLPFIIFWLINSLFNSSFLQGDARMHEQVNSSADLQKTKDNLGE